MRGDWVNVFEMWYVEKCSDLFFLAVKDVHTLPKIGPLRLKIAMVAAENKACIVHNNRNRKN
jgi:hypothetical protein